VQKESFHAKRLIPFGFGDGGGGPVRDHVEYLRRQRDLEGSPRCVIEPPSAFFDEMASTPSSLAQVPTWVGELYFQAHRGTYTTQARTKKHNRQCERALRELELWSTAAASLRQQPYPAKATEALWKDVLLHQFHDIIPGSSVHRVYEESEVVYSRVLEQAGRETQKALSALCESDARAVTLFNSLSWERSEIVELPEGFLNPVYETGQPLLTQQICGKTLAKSPAIPATGWITLRQGANAAPEIANHLQATPSSLENEYLKVTLNERGELTSIWDKESETELAAEPCNVLRLYKDVPNSFDAWDIDSNYKLQPVPLDQPAKIEVVAAGPLIASVRVKRQIHCSEFCQEIVLCAGSRRVEFRTNVEWRENHKLLKVNFPVTIRSEQALHEIQFGHISRPTHASRPSDASQFEVCQHRWTALAESNRGAAILNDCKYGVSVEGNSINLTLLRSPLAPDMTADRGANQFTYAFYAWAGHSFLESGVLQEAHELNTPLLRSPGAARTGSLFSISASNVIIETVKSAEDGSGDLVVRLYEAGQTATRTELEVNLPFTHAARTNMLEEKAEALSFDGKKLTLEFKPFEIKTIRFSY
jgi:alpha-mannosidase